MPRDDAIAVVRIQARGLRKEEKMLELDQKFVRETIQEIIEETGLTAEAILQNAAPVRTGRLKESIKITGRNRSAYRPNIRVGVEGATSDEGFPYLNVTRFGRRAVEARRTREGFRPEAGIGSARLARTYNITSDAPNRQRRPFRAHMLRFEPGPPGSGLLYRRRVKAYRPKRDWIRASEEEIQIMADFNFREVTKEIEKVLKSGKPSARRRATVSIASKTGRFS